MGPMCLFSDGKDLQQIMATKEVSHVTSGHVTNIHSNTCALSCDQWSWDITRDDGSSCNPRVVFCTMLHSVR